MCMYVREHVCRYVSNSNLSLVLTTHVGSPQVDDVMWQASISHLGERPLLPFMYKGFYVEISLSNPVNRWC